MRYLLFAFLALLSGNICAQKLTGVSSYSKAVAEAKRNAKPIMLFIEAYPGGIPPNLPPGARVLQAAINEKDVIALLEKNYIVYKTVRQDPTISFLISKYKIQRFPVFLFLHPSEEFLYVDYVVSTTKGSYFSMVDNALAAATEKTLAQLEAEYEADKTNTALVRQLIVKRRSQGISDNAALIEQYVSGLKMMDFDNYATVLFILEAGPYADGLAYRFARNNKKIIDSLYKKESALVRSAFSNSIVVNTMAEAIRSKNRLKAEAAANFSRGTWGTDYLKGQQAYSSRMLQYYHSIKDTASYLRSAVPFYDQFFLAASASAIKKIDSTNLQQRILKTAPTPPPGVKVVSKAYMDSVLAASKTYRKLPENLDTSKLVRRVERYQTYSVSPGGANYNTYASALNGAAKNFYLTGTKNSTYLSKAIIWSRRAIELNPLPDYYDTLARLLYQFGFFSESESTQKMAIDAAEKAETNSDEMWRTLKKIRNKNL